MDILELKNIIKYSDGLDSRMKGAAKRINEFEGRMTEITQSEQRREKNKTKR